MMIVTIVDGVTNSNEVSNHVYPVTDTSQTTRLTTMHIPEY